MLSEIVQPGTDYFDSMICINVVVHEICISSEKVSILWKVIDIADFI